MTLSVGSSFILALACVVALAAFIGIVLWMGRRPYFRRSRRPKSPTGVSGGVHEGDPRSMMPRRDEPVEPAEPPPGQPR